MVQILAIRAQVESVTLDEDALAYLASVAEETSLRHAAQLLTPALVLARTAGRQQVLQADIAEARDLFIDAKASARLLSEQADKYLS